MQMATIAHNQARPLASAVADQKGTCDVVLIGYEDQQNLGLRSVAAYLKQNGVKAEIEPYRGIASDAILTKIQAKKPRIVGFSLIFQRMLPDFADLIAYLREHDVDTHFTIGGHFASLEPAKLLRAIPGLDSVVRHEGEVTLLALYHELDRPSVWEQIEGLAFRRNGKTIVNPARPLIADIDTLPFPDRSGRLVTHRDLGICSISASRGCYYNCSFCSIQEFYSEPPGPKRRSRSPANVVTEMEQLFHDLGARIYVFQDDDFQMKGPAYRRWVETFLDELRTRKLAGDILWRISCRIDDLDRDMLLRMQDAGLAGIYLGIESGSDRSLSTFNKHYHVSDVYDALDMLNEIDMPYEYGFMILEPYSTVETVRENIEFLKRISQDGASLAGFCKMVPYAGTPITGKLAAEGRLEGTLASPEYRCLDPRLDLLQLFLSQTFNVRNFSNQGLVERLRYAKFDVAILEQFFPDTYDVPRYKAAIQALIRKCNESAIETLSLATRLIEGRSESEILKFWPLMHQWQESEWEVESRINTELDALLIEFGCDVAMSPGISTS